MSLVRCKECRKEVSIQASTCPQCGIPEPWKSFEEERIEREINDWKKEERRQENLYIQAGKQTFLWWGHKKVRLHVDLANAAQRKVKELREKLYEARDRWQKDNYL